MPTPITNNEAPSGTTNSLLYTGAGCAGYTSTQICAEANVCLKSNWCLPTQTLCPKRQDAGTPLCPSNNSSCKSLQTSTRCEQALAVKDRHGVTKPTATPTSPPANVTQQDAALSTLQGRALSAEIDYLCASDSCHVTHYCGDANCVKPSGSQRVACVNAQISILSRPRAVEAFVTILEDGKRVCGFSIFCFPDTEGQNCLEKQIDAGGTECRPIGRIASGTDGFQTWSLCRAQADLSTLAISSSAR